MNNKILITTIILAVLSMTSIIVFFLIQNQETSVISPSQTQKQIVKTANVPSQTLKEYTDASGFNFEYPKDVEIKQNKTGDTTYADLEITSKNATGSMSLKVVDSKLSSLSEWTKNQNRDSQKVQDATLGTLKAQEIKTTSFVKTAALDQGILFTIETDFNNEKDYWESVYKTVLSSFSFAPVQNTSFQSGNSSQDSNDVALESEEVE